MVPARATEASAWHVSTGEFTSANREMLRLMLEIFAVARPLAAGTLTLRRNFRLELENGEQIPEYYDLQVVRGGDTTRPSPEKRMKLEGETSPPSAAPRGIDEAYDLMRQPFYGPQHTRIDSIHVGTWFQKSGLDDVVFGCSEPCFDIDMDAYALVRGKSACSTRCSKCEECVRSKTVATCACGDQDKFCGVCMWLLHAATALIARELGDKFGYSHLLCSFSGNRGAHIRVFDPRALALTADMRRSLVSHFTEPPRGGSGAGRLDFSDAERVALLMPYFQRIFLDIRRIADSKESLRMFLQCTADARDLEQFVRKDIECVMNDLIASVTTAKSDKTVQLWASVGVDSKHDPTLSRRIWKRFRLRGLVRETEHDPAASHDSPAKVITLAWSRVRSRFEHWLLRTFLPRLDAGVTKGSRHQLRMPWTVNGKSHRAALPFDHTLPIDRCIDFHDVSKEGVERAMAEAERVTRDLHRRLVAPPSPPPPPPGKTATRKRNGASASAAAAVVKSEPADWDF